MSCKIGHFFCLSLVMFPCLLNAEVQVHLRYRSGFRSEGVRVHPVPQWTPPMEWYEVLGVSPMETLLAQNGCYAVLQVEREFTHTTPYLFVRLAFRESGIEAISLRLELPLSEAALEARRLCSGMDIKNEPKVIAEKVRRIAEIQKESYSSDNVNTINFFFNLNTCGIGSLPSVTSTRFPGPFPYVNFYKAIDENGNVTWSKSFASGRGIGGTLWRFSVLVASGLKSGAWNPVKEDAFSHTFTVDGIHDIADVRYEKILLDIAEFSPMLKNALNERYTRREARRKELAHRARVAAGNGEDDQIGSINEVKKPSPVLQTGLDTDMGTALGWPGNMVVVMATIAGIVFGAGLVLILVGKWRR